MADFIKIVPERVKEEAEKVRSYREQQDDVMDRLNNLVANLCDIWEGQAHEAFVDRYQEIQKSIAKFSETLEVYASAMDDASNRMQAADQMLQSKIYGLT